MLRITIEMIPFGDETSKTLLSIIEIINNKKNKKAPDYGNYDVIYNNCENGEISKFLNSVKNFKRSERYLKLIYKTFGLLIKKKILKDNKADQDISKLYPGLLFFYFYFNFYFCSFFYRFFY